jgi:hypothetical protein
MKKARHFVGRRLRQQQRKGTGASRSYAKDPDPLFEGRSPVRYQI